MVNAAHMKNICWVHGTWGEGDLMRGRVCGCLCFIMIKRNRRRGLPLSQSDSEHSRKEGLEIMDVIIWVITSLCIQTCIVC